MGKNIVILGDSGGNVTAALVAVVARNDATRPHSQGSTDPFTEHVDLSGRGQALDQQSFYPASQETLLMKIVPRCGVGPTEDA